MNPEAQPVPRKTEAEKFNKRVPYYDNDEGIALLRQLAARNGQSITAYLRDLVREKAREAGLGGAE